MSKYGIYYSTIGETGWKYTEVKAKTIEQAEAIFRASIPDLKEFLRIWEVK